MGTFTLYANATGIYDRNRPITPVSSEATAEMWRDYVFFSFDAPTTNLYKKLVSLKIGLWLNPGHGEYQPTVPGVINAGIGTLFSSFDPLTMTYDNKPWYTTINYIGNSHRNDLKAKSEYALGWSQVYSNDLPAEAYYGAPWTGTPILDVIRHGVSVHFTSEQIYHAVETLLGTSLSATHKPFLVVEYDDENVGIQLKSASPKSGYIPKNANRTFYWSYEPDGICAGDIKAETVKFRWREKNAVSYTEVNCGSAGKYTLPGSSITANYIQWQLEATDSAGAVTITPWYELSTVEALSSAVAESPKDIMVDGSAPTVFRWSHIISTGTAPTASELQVSTDGSTWTALVTVQGSARETTIPAGTLSAGELLWRVRTYNTDEAAGAWSSPASVLVVAAPPTPTVDTEQTPRPLISWQSDGQQGYQIRIPGAWESGSVYGTATSRKLPVILPDGEYTVEVRVVNEYGLWSEWGSAPLTVENVPGAAITLTASADGDISLSWSTAGSYERYLVERDGEALAVCVSTNFADMTAVGTHSYRVLGIQSGSDDYGVSNTVTVTLTVEVNSLTDVETGERLDMPYSTTQIQEERIRLERSMTLSHFTGADWPTAEISRYRDKSTSFEAAFRDLGEAARLEALLGRLVCLKTKNGESVTGVIAALQKVSSAFWVDYTAQVFRTEHREEVAL